jgi:TonB family protein
MGLAIVLCLLLICLPFGSSSADAQTLKDINKQLEGKVLIIRGFYSGDRLTFDEHGSLLKGGPAGPWTLDGEFRIDHVSLKESAIRFEGERAVVTFPKQTLQRELIGTDRAIIDVEFAHAPRPADIQAALNAAFLTGAEPLANEVPAYWQPLLKGIIKPLPLTVERHKKDATTQTDAADKCYPDRSGEKILAVDSRQGVLAPKLQNPKEPDYTEAAKKARVQGQLQLCGIVDENGRLQDIRIATPLGWGLDDQGVQTALGWRFTPATKDGKAVPVAIRVEFSFSLY